MADDDIKKQYPKKNYRNYRTGESPLITKRINVEKDIYLAVKADLESKGVNFTHWIRYLMLWHLGRHTEFLPILPQSKPVKSQIEIIKDYTCDDDEIILVMNTRTDD